MIIYFDCFSGIAGDMAVAALADLAGIGEQELEKKVKHWNLPVELSFERRKYAGIQALHIEVKAEEGDEVHFKDVKEFIEALDEKAPVKERALQIFRRLFEAEAAVHGHPFEEVHLHEAGGWDALFDVLSYSWLVDELAPGRILHSAVNVGSGSVSTSHGLLPVPVPAVVELLKGRRFYSAGPEAELTTPTGAALLAATAEQSPLPSAELLKEGRGGGTKNFSSFPNILRVFLMEEGAGEEAVIEIQAEMDDITGELAASVAEKLLSCCLDVFFTPVYMKKGRPGLLLTALCLPSRFEEASSIILRESTTIGLRYTLKPRRTLRREVVELEIMGETVPVKVAYFRGDVVSAKPEFESCKKLADKYNISLKEVTERCLYELRRKRWKSST